MLPRTVVSGPTRSGRWGPRSAFGVQLQLLAHDALGQPSAQCVLQAVGEGDLHVLNAAILHYLVHQGACFRRLVIAEEILDHLNREFARKVEHRVVKEKGDELFHRNLRRVVSGSMPIPRKRSENQGYWQLEETICTLCTDTCLLNNQAR